MQNFRDTNERSLRYTKTDHGQKNAPGSDGRTRVIT